MTNTYNIGLMICTYKGQIRYWSDISSNPSNYISVNLEINNEFCTCMESNGVILILIIKKNMFICIFNNNCFIF